MHKTVKYVGSINPQPFFDDDKDGFSEKTRGAGQGVMRGYWWRGLDCNGRDETVYPGRKENNSINLKSSF